MSDRLFIDTSFVQALLHTGDQNHAAAVALAPRLRTAAEIWVTKAVLGEIGNALSAKNRTGAGTFIDSAYRSPNSRVVTVDRPLFRRGLDLYRQRADKAWGLVDCISFVVMWDQNLTDAFTADRHFVQAGFRALLLQP